MRKFCVYAVITLLFAMNLAGCTRGAISNNPYITMMVSLKIKSS